MMESDSDETERSQSTHGMSEFVIVYRATYWNRMWAIES